MGQRDVSQVDSRHIVISLVASSFVTKRQVPRVQSTAERSGSVAYGRFHGVAAPSYESVQHPSGMTLPRFMYQGE